MTTRNGKIAVGELRRDDHQAARLLLDQARSEREDLRLDQENSERERKELQWGATSAPLLEALRAASLAQIAGPGEPWRQPASMASDLNLDLAPGTRTNGNQTPPQSSAPIQPNQTESNPIKPNQTPPPARAVSPSSPNGERR